MDKIVNCQEKLWLSFLVAGIPVVTAFGPEIGWAIICKFDATDALNLFDPVFDSGYQAEWRTMLECQRFPVHFISQKCLRMKYAGHVPTDVIIALPPDQAYIFFLQPTLDIHE